jgi:hypothetical protein
VKERRPDEPRQSKNDGHTDQTDHQRTRHPRLGVAAPQPLGRISHVDNLVWASCSRIARCRSAFFVVARSGKNASAPSSSAWRARDSRRSQHLGQILCTVSVNGRAGALAARAVAA